MDFSLNIWDLRQTHGIYFRPMHFTQDPYILLQTREFNSEFMDFTPNLCILILTRGFNSEFMDFTPYPWILFRVSIRKTVAQFLRNETQIFSFFLSFARKNNNLRNHSKKSFRAKLPYSAFAKLKFCAIPQLEFCAIPQFRKNQTVGDGVCFLEFNSGKILFWNVFLLVSFT